MKREKSLKVKWAIGLLIFLCANTLLSFIRSVQNFAGNGFSLFISFLFELLPTIAAIVLIFYDYAYSAPKRGAFSLLRMWTFGLMWVQPGLSFLSYASAGLLGDVVGYWIGSLIFPLIATILLYQDVKDNDKESEENRKPTIGFVEEKESTSETPAPAPMAEQEEENSALEDDDIDYEVLNKAEDEIHKKQGKEVVIFVTICLTIFFGIVIGISVSH